MRSEKGPNILITKSRNYYYYELMCLILALISDTFLLPYQEELFKMMKNGVYFILIALLVVELFEILLYVYQRTFDVTRLAQNDVIKSAITTYVTYFTASM